MGTDSPESPLPPAAVEAPSTTTTDSNPPAEEHHGMFDSIKSALGFGKKEEPATASPTLPDTSFNAVPDTSTTVGAASMPASLESGSISTAPVVQTAEDPTDAPAPTPIGMPEPQPAAAPELSKAA